MRTPSIGMVLGMLSACGSPTPESPPLANHPVVPVPEPSASPAASAEPGVVFDLATSGAPPEGPATLSLRGEEPVAVPHTALTVRISGASHKVSAPVADVSVLFVLAGDPPRKAEVSWRIESGAFDTDWRALAGRRFDDETDDYVEESLPGWRVRLESVDDSSAGGSPTAITIAVEARDP